MCEEDERRYIKMAFRIWEFYRIHMRPDDVMMGQNREVTWTADRLRELIDEERLLDRIA